MARSILDRLPSEISFLAPCLREMLKLRVGYRFPGDAKENPEEALDHEIERFLTRDMQIVGKWLRREFPAGKSQEFCENVSRVAWMLNSWLETVPYRQEDKELRLLHSAVGLLMNPTPYFKRQKRKKGGKRGA